jgi:hypothetical protein
MKAWTDDGLRCFLVAIVKKKDLTLVSSNDYLILNKYSCRK